MTRMSCLLAILFTTIIAGCSETQAPIKVEVSVHGDAVGTTYYGSAAVGPGLAVQWQKIQITSMADTVQIENVLINGGTCKIPSDQNRFPRSVRSGRSMSIALYDCDVADVLVKTDHGEWKGRFD